MARCKNCGKHPGKVGHATCDRCGKDHELSDTDKLIVNAAVALLESLGLADGELTKADALNAVGHVEDWLFEMGQQKNTALAGVSRTFVEHAVCKRCDIT